MKSANIIWKGIAFNFHRMKKKHRNELIFNAALSFILDMSNFRYFGCDRIKSSLPTGPKGLKRFRKKKGLNFKPFS